ncbi:hypothetical protein MRX96_017798 [Rhipicephalus microplus]
MVAAESAAEGGSGDEKDDRPAACKGSQAERKPSLKDKSTPDKHEPSELVIDELAPTSSDFQERTRQQMFSMPAGVGRGRNSGSRNPETDYSGTLRKWLRSSSPGAHKADAGRSQRSCRVDHGGSGRVDEFATLIM